MKQVKDSKNEVITLSKSINQNVSNLVKSKNSQNNYSSFVHKKIDEIQKQLVELETHLVSDTKLVQKESNKENNYDNNLEDNIMIKKKLIIRNQERRSRSFAAWIFNNCDL